MRIGCDFDYQKICDLFQLLMKKTPTAVSLQDIFDVFFCYRYIACCIVTKAISFPLRSKFGYVIKSGFSARLVSHGFEEKGI